MTLYIRAAGLAALLVAAAVNAQAANIRRQLVGDAHLIIVQGELEFRDEKKFVALALSQPSAVVFLEGPGGNLHAGIEIGKVIRLRGYVSAVMHGSFCTSACAIAWLGGRRRLIGSGAKVGFHSAWRSGADGHRVAVSSGNASIRAYLNQLGLSSPAVGYIIDMAPDGIRWLSLRDSRQFGINVEFVAGRAAQSAPRSGGR
jgi:hypothetical protein